MKYAYLILFGDGSTLLSGPHATPQLAFEAYERDRGAEPIVRHRLFIVLHPKASTFPYEIARGL